MFAVIFEVQPKPERWNDYLDTARMLRPELERIEGFIDNERFRSQRTEGRVLSLSTWQDEKALVRWRTQATHHTQGQEPGRAEIFADYHLRVGEITADTRPPDGTVLREQRFDTTDVGAAKVVAIIELPPRAAASSAGAAPADGTPGLVDGEWFESITEEGKRLSGPMLTRRRPGVDRSTAQGCACARCASSATMACATVARRHSTFRK
jgi:heme-degrading monooxygenase HmoA